MLCLLFLRLKKAAEEFYLCVDPIEIAESLKLDELTADVMYNYWILKRKVRILIVLILLTWCGYCLKTIAIRS